MEDFLEAIYQNRNNAKTYETKKYVSFKQLKDCGYNKEEIFNHITDASEKDLIDDGNDIYDEKRVALSSKGEFYVENII
ncbi:MAG: hypothetical protein ACQERJ_09355 [Bacillota bacterium]